MTALNGPGARALLIGTRASGVESGLSPVPAVERTLSDLAEALIRRCGLDAESVTIAIDPPNPTELGLALADEAEKAQDVLLVYYVGHGLTSSGGELYLATRATDRRHTRLGHTSLAYTAVRDSLLDSQARSIVVVLDCCFPGRAIGVPGDSNTDLADLTQVHGGCVLTSASRDELALSPPGETYTTFTGEFIRLLNEGDPQGPPELTLRDAYLYLSRVLPLQGFPRPHQRVSEWIEDLVLAPNPAYRNLTFKDDTEGGATTLGGNSAERTMILSNSIQRRGRRLHYLPNLVAVDHFRAFIASRSRVYVIKGPAGSGKTRLVSHLATKLANEVDFQLHPLDSWDITSVDLAVEILRYASIPHGEDALLTLEGASTKLSRPCVVIVDGISTQAQLDRIGRQIDSILRQVTAERFRFILAIRTPPDIGLFPYPILAASLYELSRQFLDTSCLITRWDERTAKEAWELSREDNDPHFTDLPESVRHLARLPLYMELLKTVENTTISRDANAFHLVDHCVRSILRASGYDADRALEMLQNLAQREVGHLIPAQLIDPLHADSVDDDVLALLHSTVDLSPLVDRSQLGRLAFGHDLIREYALATRIARLMVDRGRSSITTSALNDLAEQSTTSAMARGLFEFVVYAIDNYSPELAAAFALAPTVAVGTTLPIMLRLARAGAQFASDEVLIASAKRCSSDTAIEVARSLLAIPKIAAALGDWYAPWILDVLRRFGASIWPDVVAHIEATLDVQGLNRLLASIDLEKPPEAIFFARHFFLFADDTHQQISWLEHLLNHADWRVRAALGDCIIDAGSLRSSLATRIADRLAADEDYKVRAAIARSIGKISSDVLRPQFIELLSDSNWHVRESVLRGLLDSNTVPLPATAAEALETITSDDSWREIPERTGKLVARLMLLHRRSSPVNNLPAKERALLRLLREYRTRWIKLSDEGRQEFIAMGLGSSNWLTHREAAAIEQEARTASVTSAGSLIFNPREKYRRLRGGRSIQVALDLHDIDRAVAVAIAASKAGVDFIEVGDPLIKAAGANAIERIRRQVSGAMIVAEMMSADWGRDQVELAVEAGADVVFLIGPASVASVSEAVQAGRRLGAPILLDIPATQMTQSWVYEMERAGVDGFSVTTNIDQGVGGQEPLGKVRAVRSWTRLPVAVSGGFSTMDRPIINSSDWDIIIVGRSIAEAVDPGQAARRIVMMIQE